MAGDPPASIDGQGSTGRCRLAAGPAGLPLAIQSPRLALHAAGHVATPLCARWWLSLCAIPLGRGVSAPQRRNRPRDTGGVGPRQASCVPDRCRHGGICAIGRRVRNGSCYRHHSGRPAGCNSGNLARDFGGRRRGRGGADHHPRPRLPVSQQGGRAAMVPANGWRARAAGASAYRRPFTAAPAQHRASASGCCRGLHAGSNASSVAADCDTTTCAASPRPRAPRRWPRDHGTP